MPSMGSTRVWPAACPAPAACTWAWAAPAPGEPAPAPPATGEAPTAGAAVPFCSRRSSAFMIIHSMRPICLFRRHTRPIQTDTPQNHLQAHQTSLRSNIEPERIAR
ncbi:MAG: hypothetical protein D8H96_09650 [Lautropia sp.]|nr:MAG: hypothetical protein D8H96_09650 [Lautropia sp.]